MTAETFIAAETLVLRASDLIEWWDGSGWQHAPQRPVSAQNLNIRLLHAPQDLQLLQVSAGTALWRRQPETLSCVADGEISPSNLTPPAETLYPVEGEVNDSTGHFLPRRFRIEAGMRTGHRLPLFRSPVGTRFGRAGGLYGSTELADGRPLPWVLLTLRVKPPLVPPLEFVAQSDRHGEFRLSLQGLPALTRDAPETHYSATLRARAAADGSNPDTLPAAHIRGSGTGNNAFKAELTVEIAPGRVATLVSPGRKTLVLRLS